MVNLVNSAGRLAVLKISPSATPFKIQSTSVRTASISSDQANEYFKDVKTKDDLAVALKKVNVQNADLVANEIDYQKTMVANFVAKYPEIKNLSNADAADLIRAAFNNSFSNALMTASIKTNMVNGDCLTAFSITANGCQSTYYETLIGIWATVAITAAGTAGTAALVIGGSGLIASGIAYWEESGCLDDAVSQFDNCYGGGGAVA